MENLDMDKLLCNLAFEEYVNRKKILELKLKINDLDNPTILQETGKTINELRERANHLNELKLQYGCEQNIEKIR